MGKFPTVDVSQEVDIMDGYMAIYTSKELITLPGERGLRHKDYFMEMAAKNKLHFVPSDVSFPYGRDKMESLTIDQEYLRQYVKGHIRLWKDDPRCIETFEATRVQAEEEVYSKDFAPGVTFKKYHSRWQELFRDKNDKVQAEINEKLKRGIITQEYTDMLRRALVEILAYKF